MVEDSNFMDSKTAKGKAAHAVYDKLVAAGVKDIYFLPNDNMLGDDGEGTVDGCHHTDLGMSRQAAVFVKCLAPLLEGKK